jgi:hypothetical protein
MKLHSDLPVYKSTYDLLLGIFEFTKGFSKEYKYTVGESLKKETIDLLILIYRVNTRQDKGAVLEEAKERIEVIRLLIRLMKDLHQISIKSFVNINSIVEEVSKQLSGLTTIVCFVPLGCFSRFNKLRYTDHLKPKLRAVMKNNSPFLLSALPIFTRSLIAFVRAT